MGQAVLLVGILEAGIETVARGAARVGVLKTDQKVVIGQRCFVEYQRVGMFRKTRLGRQHVLKHVAVNHGRIHATCVNFLDV